MLENKKVMAQNILRYMRIKEKSRREVCKDLGLSYSTFSEWVSGKKYPRIDKIELMANYFNCEKSDLIEEKTEKAESQKQNDITFDDFTYAMYNETKDLTEEDKEALLNMARILKKKSEC